MLSSVWLLVVLCVGIVAIIVLTSRLKVHPFLALIAVAYGIALLGGVPLYSSDKATVDIGKAITQGFGNTLTSIGLVILFGCIIGTILEKSGAALQMADTVVRTIGRKSPTLAMSVIGYVVSIPVFCDSGYVILTPFRRALARRTGTSSVAMAVALSTGLYATHVMVPPTPGPLAAAANLELSDRLLLVTVVGLLVAAPTALIGWCYANWIGRRVRSKEDRPDSDLEQQEPTEDYDELIAAHAGRLPGRLASFTPIFVPILLMAVGSLVRLADTIQNAQSPLIAWLGQILLFAGTPVNALGIGLICALFLLPKFNEETLTHWLGDGLKSAATILIITGAGGSLGHVLLVTQVGDSLGQLLSEHLGIGIFVPFLIAATIKTAQGSSTVAITTTSALIFPLLGTLGLDSEMSRVLVVMAIGAGGMTVSHANDSYFWVVTQFSGLEVKDAYKAQTLGTLIQGTGGMCVVYLLSLMVS